MVFYSAIAYRTLLRDACMLYKANLFTVLMLLLVALTTQLAISTVELNKVNISYGGEVVSLAISDSADKERELGNILVVDHELAKGQICSECVEHARCEECDICTVNCSIFNGYLHSSIIFLGIRVSSVYFPVIPQKLLSRAVRQDRPPIDYGFSFRY